LVDAQPIRACCFSPKGEYFALGTNSKCLKICSLPNFFPDDDEEESDMQPRVLLEQQNHHNGSIYCIDWSRTGRLIATGSNDKHIKLLVCPNFEEEEHVRELRMILIIE